MGTLQLFNKTTHEPHKPINIKLTQKTRNEKQEMPNDETNEKQETRNLVVFPNPTTTNINISFSLNKPSAAKVNIYNPQGQLIYTKIIENLQQGKQNMDVETKNLQAGIYMVKLFTNQFKQTTSFIKE